MKKFVGCLICLSTTNETSTRRLPKVVTTMHIARLMAMKTVSGLPKGAGQHSGPQGTLFGTDVVVKARVSERKKKESTEVVFMILTQRINFFQKKALLRYVFGQ